MATTRLIAMHIGKGKTIAASITDRTDYAENPDKTRNGELVTGYACDPRTADAEFLLSKKEYLCITGKVQNRENDVLAYHLRQAFPPGETTPEQANKVGYELALKFTKGKHQFIVATHEDKAHIHNHIIFNSTTIDLHTGAVLPRKFNDFSFSARAVRRLSDRICLENGLSIIENPKPSKGHYGKWLGDKKVPSHRENLQASIDRVLEKKPTDFAEFIKLMQAENYEVKQGKNISFKAQDGQRFLRLRSLGEDYSETAILERIAGKRVVAPRPASAPENRPQKINLLIDLQNSIKAKNSPGYERWAKGFNLKQAASTLAFLQENGLDDYAKLTEQAAQATEEFNALSAGIKSAENRMSEISALQKHIINYSQTREVYTAYRKAGYSKKFYAEHEAEILLHKAAKQAFDTLKLEKLPTVKTLQIEFAKLQAEKKKLYQDYRPTKEKMQKILHAKANIDSLLHTDKAEPQQGNRAARELTNVTLA